MTKEELYAEHPDNGGADAVVVVSVMFGEPVNGATSRSDMILSVDGRTGEAMTDNDLFMSWAAMALQLSESKDLAPGRKQLCTAVFNHIKNAMAVARAAKERTNPPVVPPPSSN